LVLFDLAGPEPPDATLWEQAADLTVGIDPWCSGPDWVLSVKDGFAPEAEPIVLSTATGFAILARYTSSEGPDIIAGFEPLWGFACPVLGPDPATVAGAVASLLSRRRDWDQLVLPGFPADAELARVVARPLSVLGEVRGAQGISRQLARIGDFDQWLSRRSRSSRRNFRVAERKGQEAGLSFHDASNDDYLLDRLLAIESKSWKGQADSGITAPSMSTLYRRLIDRLQTNDRCHCHIARLGGFDVGYILGGVRNEIYRGLQLSYVEDAGQLSVSHLLQLHQIKLLCEKKAARTYDLGMDMPYKTAWADHTATSLTIVVQAS
jgi:CelD/BcsL family acetyltransferase involved in cellulose biosynthesis